MSKLSQFVRYFQLEKGTVCPFERVPKKFSCDGFPFLHLHIRRSFCTVGGFFRLYNLMRSSPHTFKVSRFHQGNLTKINPDPAFQTKNIFWSRISTPKNAMQWTCDPKLQCRTSARKFSALNFCIELLVWKFKVQSIEFLHFFAHPIPVRDSSYNIWLPLYDAPHPLGAGDSLHRASFGDGRHQQWFHMSSRVVEP